MTAVPYTEVSALWKSSRSSQVQWISVKEAVFLKLDILISNICTLISCYLVLCLFTTWTYEWWPIGFKTTNNGSKFKVNEGGVKVVGIEKKINRRVFVTIQTKFWGWSLKDYNLKIYHYTKGHPSAQAVDKNPFLNVAYLSFCGMITETIDKSVPHKVIFVELRAQKLW